MANTDALFTLTPVVAGVQFANADGTTKKTLATGSTNGTRIDGIFISSNDTATQNIAFYINDGSTDHYIGNVNVPNGSGYTTVARVDAIGTLAPANFRALVLPNTYILKCNMVSAVTSSDVIDVVAVGGNY